MPIKTPFGLLNVAECKREHLRLSFWLFFLAISVMFLIRHLLFMWLLVFYCTINGYIALGIYWGSARSIWWAQKGNFVCMFLLGLLWFTLPLYLAYYESIVDFCLGRPEVCGLHHLAQRKWIVYLYAALYFLGIGMMVFAELCRYRMSTYLLLKARKFEQRAAAAQNMHVTITIGSELEEPLEKDPQEIVIVA